MNKTKQDQQMHYATSLCFSNFRSLSAALCSIFLLLILNNAEILNSVSKTQKQPKNKPQAQYFIKNTCTNVTQTGVNIALVGDYFQVWIRVRVSFYSIRTVYVLIFILQKTRHPAQHCFSQHNEALYK